jgi:cytochrome c oxidase subunit 4
MEHGHGENGGHVVSYGTFVGVWLALLMLTALTVAVSGVDLKRLSVLTALAVACIKTSLVLGIFMHLKYEDRIFKVMFLVVVVTLAIFIGLTFTDTTLAR